MGILARSIAPVLRRVAREVPAVALTGPRQSGKTTILRDVFGEKARYISLEPPDVRDAASTDPHGFLEAYPPPVILDDMEYGLGLLPYIKERIDERRSVSGQYFLTGSQNLLLSQRITETLAGRAAMLQLLPLTQREMLGSPGAPLPWETARKAPYRDAGEDVWDTLVRGGYPELTAQPKRGITLWHSSYVQTYLERDVRTLRQIGDLGSFQNFLRVLAVRSGQLLNLADISRDLGVALNTVKAWLSVLEASYQVIVLRPYFANAGKRLVKTPKVYFTDTGTLCYLAGLREARHAAQGPMGGAIFETAVILEVFKTILHRGLQPQLYFWRTAKGQEVDLIVDRGDELIPVEIKSSGTPIPGMAAGIHAFRAELGERVGPGYVIHPGDIKLPLGPGVTALPFRML